MAWCCSTQASQAGARMPQQVEQKPAVVFNKVLQQLRQQQQGRSDVGTNPAPAASLPVSI